MNPSCGRRAAAAGGGFGKLLDLCPRCESRQGPADFVFGGIPGAACPPVDTRRACEVPFTPAGCAPSFPCRHPEGLGREILTSWAPSSQLFQRRSADNDPPKKPNN